MPEQHEAHAFYRRYLAALNAHQFDRMGEFLHERVTHNGAPTTRAHIQAALRDIGEAVPDFTWRLRGLVAEGDQLAALLTNTGTPTREWLDQAPTGASFEITEYGFYRLRDGRFTDLSNLHDADTLRRQLAG
ncbi:ester cyclase [Streptomyces sp. DSM 44915]|uniref:Ester cyclase n=1 Tax=Streptomyces chisholmiae TaxID=3075540 RepID=A0ABU2JLE6_9ACTN|nr:ester cyclase [Streptomyces sp. DSM 44915]MDT0265811.1 ester cyclase [Streptomyces sp. DSM 44915]